MLTKSKTKLIKVERKFSVERAVVEKIAEEIYAARGIEYKKNSKGSKPTKARA